MIRLAESRIVFLFLVLFSCRVVFYVSNEFNEITIVFFFLTTLNSNDYVLKYISYLPIAFDETYCPPPVAQPDRTEDGQFNWFRYVLFFVVFRKNLAAYDDNNWRLRMSRYRVREKPTGCRRPVFGAYGTWYKK